MKVKTILHIGMQRTGTTFFQHEVFPKINIRYISPEFFKYGHIGTLAEYHGYILKEDTLVSNENIYCDMWGREDTRFERLEIINKLFPHAKIIFGIRNKEALKKSWYKKSIGVGATWSYEEFLHNINPHLFEYETYIETLKEKFKDVYVYKFEDFKSSPDKVIEEMCNFIGVEIPEIEKEAYKRKWNIGYTERQIKIARRLNKIFKTKLNPDGIIPLPYKWHPHRIIFQKEITLRLKKREHNKILPVYEGEKKDEKSNCVWFRWRNI